MGKVKRKRVQLHNKPLKGNISEEQQTPMLTREAESEQETVPMKLPQDIISDSIFSNVNINKDALTQKLPDFDTRSTITSRTFKGLNMKKKEKRKIKHEVFMKKIDMLKEARRKAKEKKKRENTVIVGDMSLMEDALPTLELLMKTGSKSSDTQKNPRKKRGTVKEKKRRKQINSDLTAFRQVLDHPAFKQNPTAIITEHLQNKLKQEEEEMG